MAAPSFAQAKRDAWKTYKQAYHGNGTSYPGMAQAFYTEWYAPSMRAFPQSPPLTPSPSPS